MTAPPPDDELRAMLGARAGRLSPDAERSALAGFRAAVRGSADGRGGFSVLPQALSSRGARLPWGVAALGMVAIVVVAVLGGRTTPTDQRALPPDVAVATPLTSGTLESPVSAASDAPSFEHLLAAGALRGQVVVIDGRLASTACTSGVARRCSTEIVGWPGLRIVLDDQVTLASWDAAISESEDRPLAFRVQADRALAFLGPVEGVPVPMSGSGLARTTAVPGGLVLARGRLVELKGTEVFMPCPSPASDGPGDACLLRTTHLLIDERPAPDGVIGGEVDLSPGADPAVLPEDRSATFLVRWADGHWQVEGEQRLPTMEAESRPTDPTTMSPDELRATIADGSIVGRVIVIDGGLLTMESTCLRLSDCRSSAPRFPGVRIAVDPAIETNGVNDTPDGPHVFIGDGVGLTYQGTMAGETESPMTAKQLAAVSPWTSGAEVRFVEGVIGNWGCAGCASGTGDPNEQMLTDEDEPAGGTVSVAVPVIVPENIEPPSVPNRYLVRATVRSICEGVAVPLGRTCDGVGSFTWALVAAVGDEPILRVVLP